jgi:NAD(P)-dependent dehydrogenase (short-subunit alcohol dehydrogenase family)
MDDFAFPLGQRLTGRVAVVTAGSGGIGGATALRLALDGAAAVVCMDITPPDDSLLAAIREAGAELLYVQLDCTDEAATIRAFADVAERFTRVDILVNGVGGGVKGKVTEFWEAQPETWRRVIDVTLTSSLLCAHQVVPGMRERRYGKIINIASSIALLPTPKMVAYASAKAGILGFTRALALELAPFGINVNAVSPGPIATKSLLGLPADVIANSREAVPMGFLGEPSDIANAVAFLARDESRYITGQNLAVNGGRSFN